MKRQLLKSLAAALLMVLAGNVSMTAMETYDFQELCMKLGKGGPWTVNDGGDAGFTINEAAMHFLGDYTEQSFTWNQRFAYEYVEGRGKFTMRNKNNKKDKNCGMFSWDYAHYFSILDLKDGDKVTITTLAGTTSFVSTNVAEEVSAGDAVTSGTTYTIATTDETTQLDIQMASATLISKIVIEPAGEETVPAITVSPKTLKLIPGATSKLTATVDPASIATMWKSDNEAVATVAEDGTVTAVAAGTANIINYWKSEISEAQAQDVCVVTVADVDLSTYTVAKTYDFNAFGDVELTLGDEAGSFYNAANDKNNMAYFCTNEGLELIAVQAAAASSGKGWSIVDGEGLFLGSGAGRCAAVGGIKKGQIVEFIYTGNGFYTKSDKSDAGIAKTALNEGAGRAIYQADEAGMIGFELDKGNAVQTINIYTSPAIELANAKEELQAAIDEVKVLAANSLKNAIADAQAAVDAEDATLASIAAAAATFDQKVNDYAKSALASLLEVAELVKDDSEALAATYAAAKAVYENTESTTPQLVAALKTLAEAGMPVAMKYLNEAKAYMAIFDKTAAAALAEKFITLETELAKEEKDFAAIRTALIDLVNSSMLYLATGIQKLEGYAKDIDDATLNADITAIKTAALKSSWAELFKALKQYETDFFTVAQNYVDKVKAMGIDSEDVNNAIAAVEAQLAADPKNLMTTGEAVRNLVLAVRNYITTGVEAVMASTIATDGAIYNFAGQRVVNAKKGLFIINGKKVIR